MKSTELRIGNWVKDGYEFEQIEIDHLVCLSSGRCEFDPIPLTEEWLLKFGFEETEKRTWELSQIGNDIDLCISLNDGKGTAVLWQADPIYIQNIDNIHQLQNLFFALTGEELKVKP